MFHGPCVVYPGIGDTCGDTQGLPQLRNLSPRAALDQYDSETSSCALYGNRPTQPAPAVLHRALRGPLRLVSGRQMRRLFQLLRAEERGGEPRKHQVWPAYLTSLVALNTPLLRFGSHQTVIRSRLNCIPLETFGLPHRYICYINNDVFVEEGWLRALVAGAEAEPNAGELSSLTL